MSEKFEYDAQFSEFGIELRGELFAIEEIMGTLIAHLQVSGALESGYFESAAAVSRARAAELPSGVSAQQDHLRRVMESKAAYMSRFAASVDQGNSD